VTREIPGERRLDRVELHPRLFGVVPADRPSSWKLVGSPDIELVYLRRGMVDRLAEEVFGVDSSKVELLPKLGFFDGMLEQLVLGLLDAAVAEDGSADGLYADHLVRMITLHVLRCHSSRPLRAPSRAASALRPDRVTRVQALIEDALDEDLSLERLAAEAGIGTHAFSAAFVRAIGVSPHRYVVQRRIERAKRLLRESELPVATIAAQTGFASQSHLATVFKKVVGMTPGQYHRGEWRA
jgi:AraC family transcriptional regulator